MLSETLEEAKENKYDKSTNKFFEISWDKTRK